MIRVAKTRQPKGFKKDVETRGRTWLAANPAAVSADYPDYWRTAGNRKYVRALRVGFHERCGYTAHLIDHGTVDHLYSKENHPTRTYQWSNYRYASSWINSAKKPQHDGRLLDPYEVRAGWFEVVLPSMQLVLNQAKIPARLLAKAQFTLDRLPIRDDERVVDYRASCYTQFKNSPDQITARQWLHREAPLIAEAIERWQAANPGQPLP